MQAAGQVQWASADAKCVNGAGAKGNRRTESGAAERDVHHEHLKLGARGGVAVGDEDAGRAKGLAIAAAALVELITGGKLARIGSGMCRHCITYRPKRR